MSYAADTAVPIERSVTQIWQLLEKAGASGFGYMSDPNSQTELIVFRVPSSNGVILDIKYQLPAPSLNEFTRYRAGRSYRQRGEAEALKAWQQKMRSLWRLAYMSIKMKLESITQGLTVIEREFFYDIVAPGSGGRTIGEMVGPQVETNYRTLQAGGRPNVLLSLPPPIPSGGEEN